MEAGSIAARQALFLIGINVKDFIRLLNIKHWIKNGFVLAPLLFSFYFLNPESVQKAFYAFLSFCLSSSFVYIINSIRDREADQKHPVKKNRPLASGRVSVKTALVLAIILIFPIIWMNTFSNKAVLLIITAYILMNFLYTFFLKHIPIVDVNVIAFGFLMRIQAGALAIGVNSSDWILLTTYFMALFLGFSKRRTEFVVLGEEGIHHRLVFHHYKESMLNSFLYISAALAIISYALYCIDPVTQSRFGQGRMVFSVPFVVIGILRYLLIVLSPGIEEDPVEIILKDKTILLICSGWLTLLVAYIVI